jgi:carboxyl-terminal processing protease
MMSFSRRTSWSKRILGVAVVASLLGGVSGVSFAQPQNPASQLAQVEDLKNKAFALLRRNDLNGAEDLLRQARLLSNDPKLDQMTGWIDVYQVSQTKALDERKKDYDEAVADVQKLLAADYLGYAADAAARAYVHSVDKTAFHNEQWVIDLLGKTRELAEASEKSGDLLQARRLYGDLSACEPTSPVWHKKLNEVNRKLNVLALYTPTRLEDAYKKEADLRAEVARLIDPTKAPTTKPSDTVPLIDDAFKLDWKELLEGVRFDMLRTAIEYARDRYYRDASYVELTNGGIEGIRNLINTKGIEAAFPSIADDDQRKAFESALSEITADAEVVGERRYLRYALDKLLKANNDTLKMPQEVLAYEFTSGALGQLDPFSTVIWPADVPEFLKSTQQEFTGVGIQITSDDDGFLKVLTPIPDSPAMKAGIQSNDLITHINGKSAKGVSTTLAVKHITGQRGTRVKLTIKSPDGAVRDVELVRDVIKVASVKGWSTLPGGSWDYLVDHDNGIGYVRLTNFGKDTSRELADALQQIKSVGGRAVILDLRNNPGGLLTAATEVVDKFIEGGTIVSTKSLREGSPSPASKATATPDDVDLPMVVLINQYSASASEIVSGALKDHDRALLVGERTFGKGSVQQLFGLNNNAALLKLTTSHYYLPSGRCIHREEDSSEWGVDPDIVVDVTPEQMRAMSKLRQDLDVLRDREEIKAAPTTQPQVVGDQLLHSDPQLGAAILMLRMQLAGANLM